MSKTIGNGNIDGSNNGNDQIIKHIYWRKVERRNPKSCVISSSSPGSAKKDLKTFVQKNQLQYRQRHKDPLVELENLFETLNLNDEDLLERAERRDLPAKFQQSYRRQITENEKCHQQVNRPTFKRERRSKTPTVPIRRAVVPNVILDDYAFRRYETSREKEKLDSRIEKKQNSICYMWLDNYDDLLNVAESLSSSDNSKLEDKFSKDPNLIQDDLLNRRLKQSPAARVLAPPPPFGIPNSPIISNIQSTDYSKAELDLVESKKRRFRGRESIPHLINDDLAFRNLRKDIRDDFIDEKEEKLLLDEVEYVFSSRRIRYEQSHWDDAIHNYRETEHLKWKPENQKIIERVRRTAFVQDTNHIKYVHILDITKDGFIKPHVDSIRFCGDTIAGISLLSDSVMRLRLEENRNIYVDVLLTRRSFYIMTGDARYKYAHEILDEENSFFKQLPIKRDRRISVICRNEPQN